MIAETDIRERLIDELAEVYGRPKGVDGFARTLARHAPNWIEPSDLDGLADRLIATRKQKGFPAASELIAAVKSINRSSAPTSVPKSELDEWYEAERRALRLLRSSPLARRAITERWAPALIEFVIAHGREPGAEEERPLISISRRNDADAREVGGMMGRVLVDMRESMHASAERRLGIAT